MEQTVVDKLPEVRTLCRKYNVRKLELFGSAATTRFDSQSSDVDFIVEFAPMAPREHTHSFLGMWEDLKRLFNRDVDLLELDGLKNPYFLIEIEPTRKVVFE